MRPRPTPLALVTFAGLAAVAAAADDVPAPRSLPAFDRIVIDDDFPGAYQVEVADVDGDGRPDVVALGGGTCAWYENPSWRKRIITGPDRTPGIISSATADVDGDGRAEVAIAYDFAMREPGRGKLGLAFPGDSPDDPWGFRPLADVPSIHRVRWGGAFFVGLTGRGPDPDRKIAGLVVAPIFHPDDEPPDRIRGEAEVLLVVPGPDPIRGPWASLPLGRRPVLHAIEVTDRLPGNRTTLLTADNLGVGKLELTDPAPAFPGRPGFSPVVPGAPGMAPARGSSEIHAGALGDRPFLATIEPWHGGTVVAWLHADPAGAGGAGGYDRVVLDDTLDQGHALWVADVDGDGSDEVFAGHRGADHRVSVYQFDGKQWNRTVLDREIAAQDLRGGDLDGDGVPDVVAVGGSTGNVVWYRPRPSGEHNAK